MTKTYFCHIQHQKKKSDTNIKYFFNQKKNNTKKKIYPTLKAK